MVFEFVTNLCFIVEYSKSVSCGEAVLTCVRRRGSKKEVTLDYRCRSFIRLTVSPRSLISVSYGRAHVLLLKVSRFFCTLCFFLTDFLYRFYLESASRPTRKPHKTTVDCNFEFVCILKLLPALLTKWLKPRFTCGN